MADPPYPTVEVPDGWELSEETVETLFDLPTMSVRGASRRYEDRAGRDALADATDPPYDETLRFFAATRLAFEPGLPPGTLPASILPSVRQQARRSFKQRLRDRGVSRLSRGRSERLRVDGSRVRARSYTGTVDTPDSQTLPVEGWLAAWHDDDFFVVTGGYPDGRLVDVFGLEGTDHLLSIPPRDYRDDFFDLLRGVR
ncbi:MAG: hypothetical protein V5A30_08750 [Haloarculaceae archaeon]